MTRQTGFAKSNGLELAYETFGEPSDLPVLMIMGLGAQMIAWPDEICVYLADRGHFVVRFDNRDVGLSTHLSDLKTASPVASTLWPMKPPYRIADLADDAVGLLDALRISDAHIVGASMGGYIAQTLALRHQGRVRSLTLVMTSTGSRLVGYPKPRVFAKLARRRPATTREEAVRMVLESSHVIGSPGYPFDEASRREMAEQSYDRSYDPDGFLRQLAAVMAQPDRTKDLRRITVPTLVLHGLDDPLVSVTGGMALARAIPGSRFVGYPGMGHDLPQQLCEPVAEEIASIIAAGEAKRASVL